MEAYLFLLWYKLNNLIQDYPQRMSNNNDDIVDNQQHYWFQNNCLQGKSNSVLQAPYFQHMTGNLLQYQSKLDI